MIGATDLIEALAPVLALLDELGIEYAIGGSVASSAYGLPRATMDIDLVAQVEPLHAARFESALGDDYYVSTEMIRQAIRARSAFNLIHRPTMMKIDIFIALDRDYDRAVHGRRRRISLATAPKPLEAWVISPEDVVLSKLEWSRLGEVVSEVQWRDVVGVIRVQQGSLDEAYLRRWAVVLRVDDLLQRALSEAVEGDR